ncbi:hypothetical protein CKO50_20350 [Pseudoalteromonas sp. HM-SA03]|uniref:hypothetical protein n=1 Tax=Pseudoalteromonas sp. HM-SA03 TaxID=2029678 RepID=UPI000BAE4BAB|nr:hypothetical protein [Pseudoalteromonas sp. HM-SA03]PAX99565.1 hypothetical protein CKO50_20350 [Pseudoalteromonas sp. HM-SA03]
MEQEIKDIIQDGADELFNEFSDFSDQFKQLFIDATTECIEGEYNKLNNTFINQLKEVHSEITALKSETEAIRELLNIVKGE